MVQLSAAFIALGLAKLAIGAPAAKRQGPFCPPGQVDCNGPPSFPPGNGTFIDAKRQEYPNECIGCDDQIDEEPDLPYPEISNDDKVKRQELQLDDLLGLDPELDELEDAENLIVDPVKRIVKEVKDIFKRQEEEEGELETDISDDVDEGDAPPDVTCFGLNVCSLG